MTCNFKKRINRGANFSRNKETLTLENVLIICDAKTKTHDEISAEIHAFADKFGDEPYTKDIIRRTERNIKEAEENYVTKGFCSFVNLPDDNGVVVALSYSLSCDEINVNRELIAALGIQKYISIQTEGIPESYQMITKGLYAIELRSYDENRTTVIYMNAPAA